MGVPVLRSDDGGKTWENINGDNVHGDHHALWISPNPCTSSWATTEGQHLL